MFKRIGSVFIILAITVSFGFLKNVLLARELSKSDFGLFNLILTLVGLIYPIAMLGQQNTFVRFFSKYSPAEYNWKLFIRKLLLLVVPITMLVVALSSLFFDFNQTAITFLIVVILSSVVADLYTYILRAIGQYASSIFLHRSIRMTFPFALISLIYFNSFSLELIFYVFGALYILHSTIIVVYTNKIIQSGQKSISLSTCKEGLIILGSDISLLIVISVDKLFLGKLVDYETVGQYFAIYSLMRIFELALHSIDYVLIPQSNKVAELNLRGIISKVIAVGIMITGFYLIFGKVITHFVYSGKYDDSSYLIPFFCLIGFLRLLYVVPSSIISGRLDYRALKAFVSYNSILIVLNIILAFWFISIWRITGAIASTALIWFLRVCAAYIVFAKYNKTIETHALSYPLRKSKELPL